jgi:hypothetical protein
LLATNGNEGVMAVRQYPRSPDPLSFIDRHPGMLGKLLTIHTLVVSSLCIATWTFIR